MSLIIRLAETFTDGTLPKLYLDALINAGSLYLFDFCSTTSNPNADGALVNGASFVNLTGGASAAVSGTTLSNLTGKAGVYVTAATGTDLLTIGSVGSFDLSSSNHEFLVIHWYKTPATGFTSTSWTEIIANHYGNTNTSQWSLLAGSDGKSPYVGVGLGGSARTVIAASGTGLGAVSQVSLHCKPSTGSVEMYYNGTLYGSASGSAISLQSGTLSRPQINGAWKGTHYRTYMEDLTTSGASAAAQVAADYAANASRFT